MWARAPRSCSSEMARVFPQDEPQPGAPCLAYSATRGIPIPLGLGRLLLRPETQLLSSIPKVETPLRPTFAQ